MSFIEFHSNVLKKLKEISDTGLGQGTWIILTTLFSNGISEKRIVNYDQLSNKEFALSSIVAQKILEYLNSGKVSGFFSIKGHMGLDIEYIFEVVRPLNSIIILGAGHVGRSVALIASILGYAVTLIDDREDFLRDEQFSYSLNMKRICLPFNKFLEYVEISSNCAIVIVTRGHQSDEICLKGAIQTNAKYIGMIGSKRRVLAILKNLKESELSERQIDNLENVYAPIGLDIGARSPQEIAISILAQIVKIMNRYI